MKHMVREAVDKGGLRFIMPIEKLVGEALSRERLEDVLSSSDGEAVVEINPPAPNTMVKGGFDRYLHLVSAVIDGHVDPLSLKLSQ